MKIMMLKIIADRKRLMIAFWALNEVRFTCFIASQWENVKFGD